MSHRKWFIAGTLVNLTGAGLVADWIRRDDPQSLFMVIYLGIGVLVALVLFPVRSIHVRR